MAQRSLISVPNSIRLANTSLDGGYACADGALYQREDYEFAMDLLIPHQLLRSQCQNALKVDRIAGWYD